MTRLAQTILRHVRDGRYVTGIHAANSMDFRRIEPWQVEVATTTGRVIAERPAAQPHPAIEVRGLLPDGTPCKIIWSLLTVPGAAKLVTIHFYDHP